MHVHLPKPLHGWREFLGEVGIIVIGVLIALGAEQVVEATHNRHQSDAALEAIRVQLSYAAGVYEERVVIQPCLEKRLRELDSITRQARETGKLPDVGEIGRAPVRPVPLSAWSTANQNGLLMHFAAQERDALSTHYAQSADYPRQVEEEDEMWSVLGMLSHAPGPVDGALLSEGTSTLQRLKFRDWLNGLNAAQQLSELRRLGVHADYSIVTNEGDKIGREGMLERARGRPVCKPLVVDGKPFMVPS